MLFQPKNLQQWRYYTLVITDQTLPIMYTRVCVLNRGLHEGYTPEE